MERRPRPKNVTETEFLALGDGARLWLGEAAAAGTVRMRVKMSEALALAKLFDRREVDLALGHAAVHGRFAEADLASILDHHATSSTGSPSEQHRAGEDRSLTQGTSAWAGLGQLADGQLAEPVRDDEGEPEASSIPAPTQQALRTLEWVGRRENRPTGSPRPTSAGRARRRGRRRAVPAAR